MPLGPFNSDQVTKLTAAYKLGGRFLSLGRIWPSEINADLVRRQMAANGLRIPAALQALPADRIVDDKELFAFLGYQEALSMDFSAYEGSEIIHNLNEAPAPAEWHGYFDVVYNHGTIEHIFHLPNALRCCCELTKPGGVIIHSSPTNGTVDHGFYQFSPTLFFDYYRANGFEVLGCLLVNHRVFLGMHKYEFYPYNSYKHPADFLRGQMDGGSWSLVFAARKTRTSTYDVVPTQHRYAPLQPPA